MMAGRVSDGEKVRGSGSASALGRGVTIACFVDDRRGRDCGRSRLSLPT